jgi:hypothetical protein
MSHGVDPPFSVCRQKAALIDIYQAATAIYALALSELNRNIGTYSREDYVAAHDKAESLEIQMKSARAELNHHIAEHHC